MMVISTIPSNLFSQAEISHHPKPIDNYLGIWKFQTGGKIRSSPVLFKNILYFGSLDKNFYALNSFTGEKIWSYTSNYPVSSSAAIKNSVLCFESGNELIALNRISGEIIWKYVPPDNNPNPELDPWDYFHASPKISGNIVYYANEYGQIIGFNLMNGEKLFEYNTAGRNPIRSTPVIFQNRIYFGDWNGIVYCVSLINSQLQWKFNTYTGEKPYPTFGGISSEIIINNNTLYYGSRNPETFALDIETGEKKWSFSDPDGGWLISTPVIKDGNVYIGGSDNHSIYSLTENKGKLNWKYTVELNIFSRPIVSESKVIFCTGNAYKTDKGEGFIYSLDLQSGELFNSLQVGGSIFSSPINNNEIFFFGSDDGFVYALNYKYFIEIP